MNVSIGPQIVGYSFITFFALTVLFFWAKVYIAGYREWKETGVHGDAFVITHVFAGLTVVGGITIFFCSWIIQLINGKWWF